MKHNLQNVVLVLLGPTGVGKTDLSLQLAEELSGEIVSADSMQVYQGMDIGTAKATIEERNRIPHHCLDLVTIHQEYSVARYQQDARHAIDDIRQRQKLPLVVGGTGLYIQAALEPYAFSSANKDLVLRQSLSDELEQFGKTFLWNRLQDVDPDSAKKLHENDTRRVIRALEVFLNTGVPLSHSEKNTKQAEPIYPVFYLGFLREREELYQRIEQRVDEMIAQGLLEEVSDLIHKGLLEDSVPGQALGYKEFFPYFRKERSLEETIEVLKRNTRRYAKRQLTWFRRMPNVFWLNPAEYKNSENDVSGLADLIQQRLELEKEENFNH